MREPTNTNQEWNIKGADNCVRAVLSKRHDINHYYTSLEKYAPELGDGIWKHVTGSAVGHAKDKDRALDRIERLIDNEWKVYIK